MQCSSAAMLLCCLWCCDVTIRLSAPLFTPSALSSLPFLRVKAFLLTAAPFSAALPVIQRQGHTHPSPSPSIPCNIATLAMISTASNHSSSSLASATPPSPPSLSPSPLTPLTLPPLTSTTTPRDSVLSFLSLQEQRARTYHEWDSAFRLYISDPTESSLSTYTSLCQSVTEHFQLLSLHIKLLIAHLSSLPPSPPPSTPPTRLASLMTQVQGEEQVKLRCTIEQQQLASEWVVVRKEPFAREFHQGQERWREKMGEVVEAINGLLTDLRYEVAYKKQRRTEDDDADTEATGADVTA